MIILERCTIVYVYTCMYIGIYAQVYELTLFESKRKFCVYKYGTIKPFIAYHKTTLLAHI